MTKRGMRAAAMVLATLTGFYCAQALAQTQDACRASCAGLPDVRYESISDIPDVIGDLLQRAEFLDAAISQGLGFIRNAGGDRRHLTAEYVEKQKQKAARERRRQALTGIVGFDADFDGFVTEAEIEAGLEAEGASPQQSARRKADLMKMDADGDGRISLREAAEWGARAASESTPYAGLYNMPAGVRLEKLLALDIDGDGRLSDREMEALLRAAFAVLDGDGDGHLSDAERQPLRESLARRQERAQMQARAARCDIPKPAPDEDIAFLGATNITAFSTASVTNGPKTTHAAEVSVSTLDKKNYLVLASTQPAVWDLTGTTSRISRVVIFGPRGDNGAVQAGLRGLAAGQVSFLSVEECLPRLSNDLRARDGKLPHVTATLEMLMDRAPDVAQGIDRLYEATLLRGGFVIVTTPESAKLEQPQEGFDAEIWREKIVRGGMGLRILPAADIVSGSKAADLPVLPGSYGLAKLVHDGVIEKVPSGRFARIIGGGGGSSVTILEGGGHDNIVINGVPASEAAARRVPIYDYRLKKEIPAFNVRGMGIDKLLVPPNIKLPDDIGLRECSGQSGPAGERVFATHCR